MSTSIQERFGAGSHPRETMKPQSVSRSRPVPQPRPTSPSSPSHYIEGDGGAALVAALDMDAPLSDEETFIPTQHRASRVSQPQQPQPPAPFYPAQLPSAPFAAPSAGSFISQLLSGGLAQSHAHNPHVNPPRALSTNPQTRHTGQQLYNHQGLPPAPARVSAPQYVAPTAPADHTHTHPTASRAPAPAPPQHEYVRVPSFSAQAGLAGAHVADARANGNAEARSGARVSASTGAGAGTGMGMGAGEFGNYFSSSVYHTTAQPRTHTHTAPSPTYAQHARHTPSHTHAQDHAAYIAADSAQQETQETQKEYAGGEGQSAGVFEAGDYEEEQDSEDNAVETGGWGGGGEEEGGEEGEVDGEEAEGEEEEQVNGEEEGGYGEQYGDDDGDEYRYGYEPGSEPGDAAEGDWHHGGEADEGDAEGTYAEEEGADAATGEHGEIHTTHPQQPPAAYDPHASLAATPAGAASGARAGVVEVLVPGGHERVAALLGLAGGDAPDDGHGSVGRVGAVADIVAAPARSTQHTPVPYVPATGVSVGSPLSAHTQARPRSRAARSTSARLAAAYGIAPVEVRNDGFPEQSHISGPVAAQEPLSRLPAPRVLPSLAATTTATSYTVAPEPVESDARTHGREQRRHGTRHGSSHAHTRSDDAGASAGAGAGAGAGGLLGYMQRLSKGEVAENDDGDEEVDADVVTVLEDEEEDDDRVSMSAGVESVRAGAADDAVHVAQPNMLQLLGIAPTGGTAGAASTSPGLGAASKGCAAQSHAHASNHAVASPKASVGKTQDPKSGFRKGSSPTQTQADAHTRARRPKPSSSSSASTTPVPTAPAAPASYSSLFRRHETYQPPKGPSLRADARIARAHQPGARGIDSPPQSPGHGQGHAPAHGSGVMSARDGTNTFVDDDYDKRKMLLRTPIGLLPPQRGEHAQHLPPLAEGDAADDALDAPAVAYSRVADTDAGAGDLSQRVSTTLYGTSALLDEAEGGLDHRLQPRHAAPLSPHDPNVIPLYVHSGARAHAQGAAQALDQGALGGLGARLAFATPMPSASASAAVSAAGTPVPSALPVDHYGSHAEAAVAHEHGTSAGDSDSAAAKYKPKSLSQWRNTPAIAPPPSLGPDLDAAAVVAAREKRQKMRELAQRVAGQNKERLAKARERDVVPAVPIGAIAAKAGADPVGAGTSDIHSGTVSPSPNLLPPHALDPSGRQACVTSRGDVLSPRRAHASAAASDAAPATRGSSPAHARAEASRAPSAASGPARRKWGAVVAPRSGAGVVGAASYKDVSGLPPGAVRGDITKGRHGSAPSTAGVAGMNTVQGGAGRPPRAGRRAASGISAATPSRTHHHTAYPADAASAGIDTGVGTGASTGVDALSEDWQAHEEARRMIADIKKNLRL